MESHILPCSIGKFQDNHFDGNSTFKINRNHHNTTKKYDRPASIIGSRHKRNVTAKANETKKQPLTKIFADH